MGRGNGPRKLGRAALAAGGLMAALLLAACGQGTPDAALPVADATATAARAVIDAALAQAGAAPPAAPAAAPAAATAPPAAAQGGAATPAPSPDVGATATALFAQRLATDVAATLTAQPTLTPTPDAQGTAAARAGEMATAVALTLTAQPTATPTPAAAVTAAAREREMATAVALTLTAQPTATPDAAATAAALEAQVAARVSIALTAEAARRPTDTPTRPPPPATATPQPPPTAAPTPAPPAPTPGPVPCAIAPAPELAHMYNRATLGCAVNGARVVWASWTPFERGHLIWRRDTNHVYGFFNSGWWVESFDQWDQVSAAPSRGSPPPGLLAPERGAAWIWGTDDRFFNELGWATDRQKGFCALVQDFEGGDGFLLRASMQEFCHEERLYSHAREGDFGLQALAATSAGWSAATR